MTELDSRPPIRSIAVATIVAATAAASTAAADAVGGAVVLAGVFVLLLGLLAPSRRAVTWGACLAVAGIAVAGLLGGSVFALVAAAVAAAVAWDVADHAISLGAYVGRGARSERNQLVNAGTSALVGSFTAGIAAGTFLAASGDQPVAALVFLLFGAVLLVTVVR